MALALYRKYRPARFADVIGQEHVTDPLQQALRNDRVNHAYLFSGPRGCGKTSSARILARSLNCEQGPTPDPCGVCESCVGLAANGPGTLDVIELDAASHGGVDDTRELRERAMYAPVQSRYKIYIIDEAHMVTTQGFNALLKLVEEPPDYIRFIFATTEPDKVLQTIRSRTHHYPFRLVPPATLLAHLERISAEEGIAVEPGVLPLVVRAGQGSVRDALSVLDQLAGSAGTGGLTYERAASLLGYTPSELLHQVVEAVAAQDAPSLFAAIDAALDRGLGAVAVQRRPARPAARPAAAGPGRRRRRARPGARARRRASGDARAGRRPGRRRVGAGRGPRRGHDERAPYDVRPASAAARAAGRPAGAAAGLRRPGGPRRAAGPAGERARRRRPGDDRLAHPARGAFGRSARGRTDRGSRGSLRLSGGGRRHAGARGRPGPGRRGRAVPGARPRAGRAAGRPEPEPVAPVPAAVPTVSGSPDVASVRQLWPHVLESIKAKRRVTWMLLYEKASVLSLESGVLTLGLPDAGTARGFAAGDHPDVVRAALLDVVGVEARVDAVPHGAAPTPSGGGAPGASARRARRPRRKRQPRSRPEPRRPGAPSKAAEARQRAEALAREEAERAATPDEPDPGDADADDSGKSGGALIADVLGGRQIGSAEG